jgi:hypothetical protein
MPSDDRAFAFSSRVFPKPSQIKTSYKLWHYQLCTPHERLAHTPQTTPAMAVGITDHGWTMHVLLSLHVPLSRWAPPQRRGRPSRTRQRLIERWGS